MITRQNLSSALDRLVRNTGVNFTIDEYNGYCHLTVSNGTHDISNGNKKSELYYQIITACKIIEFARKHAKEMNDIERENDLDFTYTRHLL